MSVQTVRRDMDRGSKQEDPSMAALEAFAGSMRTVLAGSNFSEAAQRELVGEIVCALTSVFEYCGKGPLSARIGATRVSESVKLSTRSGKDRERGGADPSSDMLQP